MAACGECFGGQAVKEDHAMAQRHALTDAQWKKIESLLPGKEGDSGRTAADNRLFVDAVLWIHRTGAPWRDLPERFGLWNSVWRRFRRWCAQGVWERLVKELGHLDLEELQLDSTSIKVHVSGSNGRRQTGEKKKPPTRVVALVDRGAG
jgi:transposase